MTLKFNLLIIALLLCSSCKSQTSEIYPDEIAFQQNKFSKDSLLNHVKVLSSDFYEGRRTDTEGAAEARTYIATKFKSLNVPPLKENYEQPFHFFSRGKTYNGVNMLGLIKGSMYLDKYIVISAHYDHEGIKRGIVFNGADDDASGISALFAFAEYFKSNPPKHSIIFAAFDAEELGLKGAKHFVKNPIIEKEKIALNINMDMISRNDQNELYVVGSNLYEHLKPAIAKVKLPNDFSLLSGHDGLDRKQNWVNSGDHAPFNENGIPFLYFGVEDHKDYHRPTDDFENIHPNFYTKSVYTIISIFQELDTMKH